MTPRVLVGLVAAGVLLVATGCADEAAEPAGICTPKDRGAPCAHAKVGVEYPVALLSHCGAGWAYFAGRFWVIDPPQPEGANGIYGVMSVVGDYEFAHFRGDDGRRYAFKPAPETFTPPPCA